MAEITALKMVIKDKPSEKMAKYFPKLSSTVIRDNRSCISTRNHLATEQFLVIKSEIKSKTDYLVLLMSSLTTTASTAVVQLNGLKVKACEGVSGNRYTAHV